MGNGIMIHPSDVRMSRNDTTFKLQLVPDGHFACSVCVNSTRVSSQQYNVL